MSESKMTPDLVPVMFTMIEPGLYEYSVEGVESLDRVQVKRLTSKTWGLFLSLNDAHPVAEYSTKRACEDHLRATAASQINAMRRAARPVAEVQAERSGDGAQDSHDSAAQFSFQTGDEVIVVGADPRVWWITDFEMVGSMPWAKLRHRTESGVTNTSVPVKRLEHAEGRTGRPMQRATSQPATSQSRPAGILDMVRPHVDAIHKAVAQLAEQIAVPAHPEPEPWTIEDIVQRIERRAKYDALKAVLAQLDGSIETTIENSASMGHRDGPRNEDQVTLYADDVRNIVNGAARDTGTSEPWRSSL